MADTYTVTLLKGRLSAGERQAATIRFRRKLEETLGPATAVCQAKLASDIARSSAPRIGDAAIDRWLNAFSAAHFWALAERFHEPVEFRVDVLPFTTHLSTASSPHESAGVPGAA